jgi:phage tail-like protein
MADEATPHAIAASQAGAIVVRLGDDVVARVPLTAQELTIGRSPNNTIVLPEATVSSHHARLQREGNDWLLTDIGSTNGTTVNGSTLLRQQPARLADGTDIAIGPFTLRYQAPEPVPEPETAPQEQESHAERADQQCDRRPTFPPLLPEPCAPSRYLTFLPTIFQDTDFLRRFLLIFEALWEPLEWRQDHIDMYFDPRTCPAALLPWLAGRLDLAFPPGWPERRMRNVLAEATTLLRWRGTRYGLERLIELFTGLTPRISEHRDEPYVFHIALTVPAEATVDDVQVEALIRAHKPAHAGYVLEVLRERAT